MKIVRRAQQFGFPLLTLFAIAGCGGGGGGGGGSTQPPPPDTIGQTFMEPAPIY